MPGPNPRLTAVPDVQALLVCTRLWSTGAPIDEGAVARLREAVLVGNHRRYAAAIPAYAALVDESPAAPAVTVADIRDRFLVTDGLFKSYDPAWLEDAPAELTRWLGSIFTERLTDLDLATGDINQWRAALKRHGVYVTFSSGTGGRPSLVPRDRPTLAALRACSGVRLPWTLRAGTYDFLQLVAPGLGLGIQSGAAGLAAGAVRVHHLRAALFDLRSLTGGPGPPGAPDHDAAADFLARSERPVLVFGTPAEVSDLIDHLASAGRHVRLLPGSQVVTGGGWKGRTAIRREELVEGVRDRLGVPPGRCVDTYSTSELNTVFLTCVNDRYHVPPCVEPVVVDDLLVPVDGDDVVGRLAVLDPFALSYPGSVVTGDAVRLRRDPCGCGLAGPTLAAPIVRAAGAGERGCATVEGGAG
ncbi:LuxE/PaaK family acyltransferase [Streptosporangium sp. NPDC003464]